VGPATVPAAAVERGSSRSVSEGVSGEEIRLSCSCSGEGEGARWADGSSSGDVELGVAARGSKPGAGRRAAAEEYRVTDQPL